VDRRTFIRKLLSYIAFSGGVLGGMFKGSTAGATAAEGPEGRKKTLYGFGVSVDKCIGCARCVVACKTENDVPKEPFFYRTWVERYIIPRKGEAEVINIHMGLSQEEEALSSRAVLRSFFVPKLCNQCDHPPCVQVCPVGATFSTEDGIILVNEKTCIGCRYCIQACPYGARYLHPATHTADKCTFCYHRLQRGLLPACVEVCPTQARVIGDLNSPASPMTRFRRMNKIFVLKGNLNTEPKVLYAGIDGEVR
jgi:tetrathionate reductase subunit B